MLMKQQTPRPPSGGSLALEEVVILKTSYQPPAQEVLFDERQSPVLEGLMLVFWPVRIGHALIL